MSQLTVYNTITPNLSFTLYAINNSFARYRAFNTDVIINGYILYKIK